MAPKSTCVRSGKISASAVKRQPAGSRLISSPGCAHRPGMRRAMVIEAADSFIANVLRYMDGSRHRVHPALRALHHCLHDLGALLTGGWPLEAAGLRRGISSSGGGPIGSAVYGGSTYLSPGDGTESYRRSWPPPARPGDTQACKKAVVHGPKEIGAPVNGIPRNAKALTPQHKDLEAGTWARD